MRLKILRAIIWSIVVAFMHLIFCVCALIYHGLGMDPEGARFVERVLMQPGTGIGALFSSYEDKSILVGLSNLCFYFGIALTFLWPRKKIYSVVLSKEKSQKMIRGICCFLGVYSLVVSFATMGFSLKVGYGICSLSIACLLSLFLFREVKNYVEYFFLVPSICFLFLFFTGFLIYVFEHQSLVDQFILFGLLCFSPVIALWFLWVGGCFIKSKISPINKKSLSVEA